MQRLAARLVQAMDDLAERYERRLQGVDGGQAQAWDARRDLALVARCLETGDGAPLVAGVGEEMDAGASMGWLRRRLSALEQTLIPQVDDVETATFLWETLARAREALESSATGRTALSTDLAEHERADQALRESEELFRSVVENSMAGIFIVDNNYRFIYANDQLLGLVGYQREEVIGQPFQLFLDDESKQMVADRYVRRQRGEDVPPRYEFNIVRKSGEKRRVEISSAVITDSAGNVRTLAQLTDITEQKRLEQQIQESLARRGRQVQTSTEIAQEIASAPALDEIYRRVVTLVKERFGYYHTQLFLASRPEGTRGEGRWLSVAGYGEIGEQLVGQGSFVPAGEGVVGRAGATGQAVLVPNVSDDPEWIYDPLLPDTKGELAVPIVLRRTRPEGAQPEGRGVHGGRHEEVVGVLDVQSDRAGALTEEDELVLEGLCGQIAIAIESTRLREQTEESLRTLEGLYRRASREGWEAFQQQVRATGYRYDQAEVKPEPHGVSGAEGELALARGDLAGPALDRRSASIAPLSVWGETFGILGVEADPQNPLLPDDVALLEAVAEQVAQALEGARLFDEEQRARLLLDMRVNELGCLNDVGRKIDQAPPVGELLEWVCGRLPAAMQFPDSAIVAIELEGRLYGVAEALQSPWQMVQNLQVAGATVAGATAAGGKGKICIAYRDAHEFLDEESALLGDVARRIAGYVENRRLFEQTQQALRETEVLLRLTQRLGQLDDEQEMFEFILPQYLDVIGLKQGGVLLLDLAPGRAAGSGRDGLAPTGTLRALVRGGQLVEAGMTLPVAGNPAMEQLVATAKPVVVHDALTSELVAPVREIATELGYRSLLLVPIFGRTAAGTKVLGALGADSTDDVYEFTEREVALVQAVADQLSIAMENRRLLRSMEEALTESQALYRAASMVATFESLDSTLQAVVDSVAEAVAADMVALYRLDMDQGKVIDYFQGGPDESTAPLTAEELWAGLTGWVLRNQAPVLSLKGMPDPREDEESRQRRADHGHGSLIVVPIRYRGTVIGTLTAVNKLERDDFTESDVELMTGLANQAAAAIENMRLFDEAQGRAQEQALLNEIGRALAACQDVESLVAQTHSGAVQLLGVENMYVALYDAEQGDITFPLMVLDAQVVEPPPPLRFGTGGVIDYMIETREPMLWRERVMEQLSERGIKHNLVREGQAPASALGVPISMGDRVLGMILVWNYVEPRAFNEQDRDLLVTLSNHVALALQNVRLLEETRAALAEAEAAHRTYLRRGWEDHLRQNRMLEQGALLYDGGAIRQVYPAPEEAVTGPREEAATVAGATVAAADEEGEWSTITVPIMLRGQKLGVIGVEVPTRPASPPPGEAEEGEPGAGPRSGEALVGDRQWSEDDYALLEAVSEQLGQTLESARLFADTQRLAERERLIGEITARIRASTDMRDILETTAVELGRALGTSRALVRLTASRAVDDVAGATVAGATVVGQDADKI
ncbi:MAG: GAF domain-containing protein [Anaerolineae bacterium]|nr:GAF domain-containing protein [Anaerolineae bacterium]